MSARTRALEDISKSVDAELNRRLPAVDVEPVTIHEAMRYSMFAGGKRLRPALVILSSRICGGSDGDAMPAACAIECVHTYSLIHDDLPAMDDDDLRRGKPTCHIKFGEAMAVLAGDALLTLAFELVSHQPEVVGELAAGAGTAGMIGGQVADMESEGTIDRLTTDDLRRRVEYIHRHKTAALIRSAMRMGALSAHAGPTQLNAVSTYGQCLGLAFQIVDDILDMTGTEADMGKAVGKDIQRGKLIYPAVFGLDESRKKASQLVDEAVSTLKEFGPEAEPLRSLAVFVLKRSS